MSLLGAETRYGQARARRWSCDDKGLIQLGMFGMGNYLSMTLRPWRLSTFKEIIGRRFVEVNRQQLSDRPVHSNEFSVH